VPSPALVLSYWLQVAAVAAIVGLMLAAVARSAPRLRLVSWRAVLLLAVLLPLAAFLPARSTPTALGVVSGVMSVMGSAPIVPPLEAPTPVDWTMWLALGLAAGAAVKLARLLAAWLLLRQVCRRLPAAECPLFEQLRTRLGVDATLVWHDGASQPFTFGHRPALVVLPADLVSAPAAELSGIFAHELTHVARRDWRWLVVEEAVGAMLWFHPAIGLALREIRQAREELVDRATVALTGARRTYLETLVTLAGRPMSPHGLSLSITGARQLPRRIAALATEVSMSRIGVVVRSTLVILAGAAAVTTAVQAFPLTPFAQAAAGEAGPLEKQAYVAPRDAPPPVRLHYVAPALPADAGAFGEVDVEMRLVVDANGRVVEARSLKSNATKGVIVSAVVDAARQWRFERPTMAPLALTMTLMLRPSGDTSAAGHSSIERPMPVEIKNAVYPDDARQAKVEGIVQAEITIGADGRVTDVRVVSAPMPSMGEATAAALKASTFRPGMKDGQPVPVNVTMSIRFALK